MTDLKYKMVAALKEKNDVKNFIWKGKKEEVNGELMQRTIKLWDCDLAQLQQFYDHCETMLYNDDKEFPGRIPLLEIVRDQRQRCNCELFLRWLEHEKGMSKFRFMEAIRTFIANNKESNPDIASKPISLITAGCPDEFSEIPIGLVLDGCLDTLGKFDRKHITLLFIIRQGLCLSDAEKKDLTKKDANGNTRDKLDVIKETLDLNTPIKLFMSPTGLSYDQFRAMINLRYRKYSELTTMQLQTLRNRILFTLEDNIQDHIKQWQTREKIIMEICKLKNYDLVR